MKPLAVRKRRSPIVIDTGAAGLRGCQLQAGPALPWLVDALRFELSLARNDPGEPESTSRRRDENEPRATATATAPLAAAALTAERVARLAGAGRFHGRDAALVLSPPDAQFYPLRLPDAALAQPLESVHEALRLELAQQTRLGADELEVRYWRLPPAAAQQANVMAVALPIASALQWYDELAARGLRLARLDVSPCALTRAALRIVQPRPDDVWGVLDLGLRHTTLTVVVGQTPCYIRALTPWARACTDMLAGELRVTPLAAERLKREHGLTAHTQEADSSPEQAEQIHRIVAERVAHSLKGMIHDVIRCFAYMTHNVQVATRGDRDVTAQQLVLAGGGAQMPGLSEFLSLHLELPVTPLVTRLTRRAPSESHETIPPAAAAAMGAAWLALEDA